MRTVTVACTECGTVFSYQNRSGPPKKRCVDCIKRYNAERQLRWRKENPDRAREHWTRSNRKQLAKPEVRQKKREQFVLRRYGLTPAQLQEMLDKQTGCTVCGGPPNGAGTRFHIDHCHNSGRVRGLLCAKCNTLIGLSGDNPETLEKAAAYLRT